MPRADAKDAPLTAVIAVFAAFVPVASTAVPDSRTAGSPPESATNRCAAPLSPVWTAIDLPTVSVQLVTAAPSACPDSAAAFHIAAIPPAAE